MAGKTLTTLAHQARRNAQARLGQGGGVPVHPFPGVDTCSGPRCARPARSWASTAISPRLRQEPARRRHQAAGRGTRLRLGAATATRRALVSRAQRLVELGFGLLATRGTPAFLAEAGHDGRARSTRCMEGRPHIVDLMKNGEIQLVFNTRRARSRWRQLPLRRTALMTTIPYYTTRGRREGGGEGIEAQRADTRVAPCNPTVSNVLRSGPAMRLHRARTRLGVEPRQIDHRR